jgi:hypothetical protein
MRFSSSSPSHSLRHYVRTIHQALLLSTPLPDAALSVSPSPSSILHLHHIRAQAAAFLPLHHAHRALRRRGCRPPHVARRPGDGSSLAGPRPGVGAAGCCQVASPSSAAGWPKPTVPRSTLRCPEEEEWQTMHVSRLRFKCFRSSIGMLQVFHMDVAKVDRDVAYVAMVVHVCCKLLFLMFYLFFRCTL